ncbi:unnamed protein product [Clavelina lepadiformis]|uniref:Uncharacterized protein n=1 Tax=Clavelina lepadiformis TaxID=159417 RepID=A0ABP0FW66_CLALP
MPMHVIIIRFETERKKMKQTVLVLCIALPFATQFSRGAINRSRLDRLKERTVEMQAHIVDLENTLDAKSTEIETLDDVLFPLQQEEASTKNSLKKCVTELKEFNSSLEPTIPNPLETKTVSLEDVENRTTECKRKLAEQQTYTEELEEKLNQYSAEEEQLREETNKLENDYGEVFAVSSQLNLSAKLNF